MLLRTCTKEFPLLCCSSYAPAGSLGGLLRMRQGMGARPSYTHPRVPQPRSKSSETYWSAPLSESVLGDGASKLLLPCVSTSIILSSQSSAMLWSPCGSLCPILGRSPLAPAPPESIGPPFKAEPITYRYCPPSLNLALRHLSRG